MVKYYKPSGKFSPTSFLYFALIALIALPILGLIYAYAIWYIPFIYINFIIAGAFGFGVGYLIKRFVIKQGKVRNTGLAFVFAILAAIIALYFHWAVWVDLVINAGESYGSSRIGVTVSNIEFLQVFNLALNPSALFSIISEINPIGTWGIKGTAVSGTFLTVIWVIEFLIVTIVAILVSFTETYEPFCEDSDKWFNKKQLKPTSLIEEPEQFLKHLESSAHETFDILTPVKDLNSHHSIFTLYTSDKNENYLTVTNKIAETNKKGETELKDYEIVEYIYLNNEMKQALNSKVA